MALAGHVDALAAAVDVDAVAVAALRALTHGGTDGAAGADGAGAPRGAVRAGFALTEGGGRRLLFCPSDALAARDDGTPGAPAWCHIDAYDDVPLTRAVRTGRTVAGTLDDLALAAAFVERQRGFGVAAIVAAPIAAAAALAPERLGGLVLFLDRAPDPGDVAQVEALAAEVAVSLRRLRAAGAPDPHGPDDPDGRGSAGEADPAGRRTARVRLPGEPGAPRAARHFVRERLEAWGAGEDVVDAALLCASELVTNAVVHTGSTTNVDLAERDGLLVLGVRDHGTVAIDPAAVVATVGGADGADPLDALLVAGRGLGLVAALSADWGAETADPGLRVWCALAG